MRCFVALTLPQPVRNHLANLIDPLRDQYNIKWVDPHQFHLTLAFAADLPDENLQAVKEVINSIELPALSLSLQRFGWFPPRGVPHVVWVSLTGDVGPLAMLQHELANRVMDLGFSREQRAFVPHITLGRVKSPHGALTLLDGLNELTEQIKTKPFPPRNFVLFRSTLRRTGPLHEPLVSRELPEPNPDQPNPDQPNPDQPSPDRG